MTERDYERVSELVIDEWIWVVFIILSILNISGDELEKHYCYYHKKKDKEVSKKIFKITVFVSLLIYIYLANKNCRKYKIALERNQDVTIVSIRKFASILIVVASSMLLYAQLNDIEPNNPSIQ